MIERRTIVFSHPLLAGVEHPAFEARGAKDGPRVTLLGGIHGCEYSSIAAVTRVMNELDTDELAGSITAVPVVSMQSFQRRSRFVVPEDGKNLNRCFPGSYDGTYSDVLARSIFDELIEPADVLLDLHGGDMVAGLEPFSICEAAPVEERAHAIAVAFGLPYVVREERQEGGLGGMTSSAAAQAGIPAIIAEAGGGGQVGGSAGGMVGGGLRAVGGERGGDAGRRRAQRPAAPRDAAGPAAAAACRHAVDRQIRLVALRGRRLVGRGGRLRRRGPGRSAARPGAQPVGRRARGHSRAE